MMRPGSETVGITELTDSISQRQSNFKKGKNKGMAAIDHPFLCILLPMSFYPSA
jgi:hypothetical protein